MKNESGLRVSGYCQVRLNHRMVIILGNLVDQKDVWVDGVIASMGAKRAQVDIGKKVIQKRLAFVRPV